MLHTLRIVLPLFFLLSGFLPAALILNPARPITHQITVHPIRVFTDDGSTAATYFGNASQKAEIIDLINQIWAQMGVSIIFLPESDYYDTFTYNDNGESENSVRSQADLNTFQNDPNAPTTASNTDIEMFFVEVPPGFRGSDLILNASAGLATVDRPGSTIYVGSNLLGFLAGREAIASVVAHEIGHNLGLEHLPGGSPNLMANGASSSDELESNQLTTIFTDLGGIIDGYDLLIPISSTTDYDDFVDQYDLQLGPTGDDDSDTLSNLLEYAIGSNPTTPGSLPSMVKDSANSARWTIPKSEDAVEEGVTYTVMVSSDLENFQEAGSPGSNTVITTDTDTSLSVLFVGTGPFFAKLVVERP